MSRPSIVPFVLVVTLPIGLFLFGLAAVIVLSAVVWDRVQTESFMSKMSSPLGQTFSNMRQVNIKNQATQLVGRLNQMDPGPNEPDPRAKTVLRQLIILSGEDFGTRFKGDARKYTWREPMTGEEWALIMRRVNRWSDRTFGTDWSSAPAPITPRNYEDNSSDNYENVFQDNEPPPTYELPEERGENSYYPPPRYQPSYRPSPPPDYYYNNYDNGEEISPEYNDHDSFQPEDD